MTVRAIELSAVACQVLELPAPIADSISMHLDAEDLVYHLHQSGCAGSWNQLQDDFGTSGSGAAIMAGSESRSTLCTEATLMPISPTPEVKALLAISTAQQMQSVVFAENDATIFLARGAKLGLEPGDKAHRKAGWRFTLSFEVPEVPHDGDQLAINLASMLWDAAGLLLCQRDDADASDMQQIRSGLM